MKKIFTLIIVLCIGVDAYSQKNSESSLPNFGNIVQINTVVGTYFNYNPNIEISDSIKFTYLTELKDTLYIQNNTIGLSIKEIWDTDSIKFVGKKPIIIMVSNLKNINENENKKQ